MVVIALASHLRDPGSGHEWAKLVVGSLLCFERFLSWFSGLNSPPLKNQHSQIPNSNSMGCRTSVPENHFRVSGASWVNINKS